MTAFVFLVERKLSLKVFVFLDYSVFTRSLFTVVGVFCHSNLEIIDILILISQY